TPIRHLFDAGLEDPKVVTIQPYERCRDVLHCFRIEAKRIDAEPADVALQELRLLPHFFGDQEIREAPALRELLGLPSRRHAGPVSHLLSDCTACLTRALDTR